MQVDISEAVGEERQIIRNLFLFYFHDMAQWDEGLQINAYGLPVWTAFGEPTPRTWEAAITYNWWIRNTCRQFLIRADGNPAGFAIVNQGPHMLPVDIDVDMQDFFIVGKYRRQGIGHGAALHLFDMFRGRWEVVQLARNATAITFWHKVIAEYTGGKYTTLDEGARQRFDNRLFEDMGTAPQR